MTGKEIFPDEHLETFVKASVLYSIDKELLLNFKFEDLDFIFDYTTKNPKYDNKKTLRVTVNRKPDPEHPEIIPTITAVEGIIAHSDTFEEKARAMMGVTMMLLQSLREKDKPVLRIVK